MAKSGNYFKVLLARARVQLGRGVRRVRCSPSPDGGDGDSGPATPSQRQIVAEGICEAMAGVPDCTVPEDCVQNQIDFQGYADALPPECANEVLDFATCLSTQDADSFTCFNGAPDIDYGSNGCPDEEAAFIAIGDGSNCPE